jgi:hypothetical protein
MTRGDPNDEARQAAGIANALECSIAVFCVGAAFLSLELFELPYLIIMMSLQLPLAWRTSAATEESRVLRPLATPSPVIAPVR